VAGGFVMLVVLLGLSAGSLWLVRRFGLLKPGRGSLRRYEAIQGVARPSGVGTTPLNIGLILILSAMALWVIAAMLASIPYTLASTDGRRPEPSLVLTARVLAAMNGGTILIVVIAWAAWPSLGRMLGLPAGLRELLRDLKIGLIALVVALPPVLMVAALVSLVMSLLANAGLIDPVDPLAHDTLRELVASGRDGSWWAVIGLVVIATPIAEEILYRGVLQTGVRANLGVSADRRTARLDWFAVAVVSVLFTLVHYPAVPAHALIVLFALSVAMGLAYERTGRLLVPVVMHIGFNALNIAMSQIG
jgi:membrane protease YdiL (CAAX protease family)